MNISIFLKEKRIEQGSLDLSNQEVYIDRNHQVQVKEHIPVHGLVEEFMLLANISVAKFIYKNCPDFSLLRFHPLPSLIDLDGIDASSSKTIGESLNKLNEEQRIIANRIITRSMQQALYICSGYSDDYYHYCFC